MWTWGIGLLLLGHAFVHAVWRTYGPKTSWLLANSGETTQVALSTILFVMGAIGFTVAGLGVLMNRSWWQPVAVVSSVVSLLLLGIFWNRGLFVGAAIDLVLLASVWWLKWPAQVFAAQ